MVDLSGVLARIPGRDDILAALDRIPAARGAVSPFVAGDSVGAAVTAVGEVASSGMGASVLYLPMPDAEPAARLAHMQVIEALAQEDLAAGTDLTVSLPALGLGSSPPETVEAEVAALCAAAAEVGMTVTFAGLRHPLVEEVLLIRSRLAGLYPDLGVTIAANLRRSEGDCLDLAEAGARVRLIKREEQEDSVLAFRGDHDVDKAYVRCLRLLMDRGARPILFTHDSRLIEIAAALAERADREPGQYSFQFRRGLNADLAAELVAAGSAVSVLVPFGPNWPDYVSRRIGVSPASLGQAARAAAGRGAEQ